jgi:hypothetical protein
MACSRFVALIAAGSLCVSSTGAVAATASSPIAHAASAQQLDPWATLSALSGVAPAAALCGAAVAAAAQPAPGCVLPVADQAPIAAAPPAPVPVPPVEPASAGLGIDPLWIALGVLAAGALIYFLLIKKHHHHHDESPD